MPEVDALDENLLVAVLGAVGIELGRVLLHRSVHRIAEGFEVGAGDDVVELNITVALVGRDLGGGEGVFGGHGGENRRKRGMRLEQTG